MAEQDDPATKKDVDQAADRVIVALQDDDTDLNEPGLKQLLLEMEKRVAGVLKKSVEGIGPHDGS